VIDGTWARICRSEAVFIDQHWRLAIIVTRIPISLYSNRLSFSSFQFPVSYSQSNHHMIPHTLTRPAQHPRPKDATHHNNNMLYRFNVVPLLTSSQLPLPPFHFRCPVPFVSLLSTYSAGTSLRYPKARQTARMSRQPRRSSANPNQGFAKKPACFLKHLHKCPLLQKRAPSSSAVVQLHRTQYAPHAVCTARSMHVCIALPSSYRHHAFVSRTSSIPACTADRQCWPWGRTAWIVLGDALPS
jgi:hypothetical protein